MELTYLSINTCLTFTLASYTAAYAMNVVKNNIANTIKAELDKAKSISIGNFIIVKKEIGVITRAEFLVRILWITAIIQTTIYLGVHILSQFKESEIPNAYLRNSENSMVTLFALCLAISFISVCIVFNSPRQNLLSGNWEIPE